MKSSKKQLLIALIGAFLVVSAIVTAVCIPIMQNHRIKQAQKTVSRLKELMPKIHQGSYDDRINVAMPSVELDGESFIGIIEIPSLSVSLPVCSEWNKNRLSRYPHRYTGSLYDNSLIVGGSGNKGQFDFMKVISPHHNIFFTDMTGASYSFFPEEITVKTEISEEDFLNSSQIILFSKDPVSSKYTVIHCKTSQ